MKRIICLLAPAYFLLLSGPSSLAQRLGSAHAGNEDILGSSLTWGVLGGISYLIPQKEFLRQNYDNAFPIIALDFPPLSVELGALYRLTPSIDLMMDVGARKHILKATEGLEDEGELQKVSSVTAFAFW